MSVLSDLELKTRAVNQRLAEHDVHMCWGGDFTQAGNVFDRGAAHLMAGKPAIFPICLNNGYYSEGQIENLARAIHEFGNPVYVFLTDGPAKHNFRALEYPEDEIIRRTRLERNGLLSRLARSVHVIGGDAGTKFGYFDWHEIYKHPLWQEKKRELETLYAQNPAFKSDIENMTRKVLTHRKKTMSGLGFDVSAREVTDDDVRIAKNYTLDEVAFVSICPQLLGVDGICYLYKEGWPVFEKLSDGVYTGIKNPSAGFLAFHTVPEATANAPVILSLDALGDLAERNTPLKCNRPDAPKAVIRAVTLATPQA